MYYTVEWWGTHHWNIYRVYSSLDEANNARKVLKADEPDAAYRVRNITGL